ncbi:MAG: hypothetical protein AB7S81_04730 [Bdellovibrionales bacterium]
MIEHPPLYKYLIEMPYGTNTADAETLLRTVHGIVSPVHYDLNIPYIPQIKRTGPFSPAFCFATTPDLSKEFTTLFGARNLPSYYRVRQASSGEFRSYAIRLMAGTGPYSKKVPDNALRFLRKCGALVGNKTTNVTVGLETFKQLPFQSFPQDAKEVDALLRKTAVSVMKVANCRYVSGNQSWTIESRACLAIVVDHKGEAISDKKPVTQKAVHNTALPKKVRKAKPPSLDV